MNPQSISEQMMYSTVRLETKDHSTGTGFFFHFALSEKEIVPVIVTNKHVVNHNEEELVQFCLHIKSDAQFSDEKLNLFFQTQWHFHPKLDLCFCFLAPLLHQIKEKKNKEVFYIPITEEIIWSEEKLQELSAIEDVVMVGYPNGLWDRKNNLPLFRKGITSTHPATDFNQESMGVVDMACFPGSSGSPIFILNEGGYTDKKGNTYLGGKRLIFLGVLFQGPQLNAKGELIIENIPTQQKISAVTPMMINLGNYIKAKEILALKSIVNDKVAK